MAHSLTRKSVCYHADLNRNLVCDRYNLSDSVLVRTNFHGADLSGANFAGALLGDTILTRVNLTGAHGLEDCRHAGPSSLDIQTLMMSGKLPENFLRGCGLPEKFVEYLSSIIDSGTKYYSCFISYSHVDEAFALRLHDQLQSSGARCWLDEHHILPGDDPYQEIEKGIRNWDKVLLCCSKSSLTSWWVDNEIKLAFAKERDLMRKRGERKLVLIPLNLDNYLYSDECGSAKAVLIKDRTPADFVDWQKSDAKFDKGVDRVILALRSDRSAREKPPEPRL